MKYGIYDTVERCWIGNDDGPTLHDEYLIARIAAQVMDVRTKQEPGRTIAKPFAAGRLRKRDTVSTVMSTEEALERLEDGRAL